MRRAREFRLHVAEHVLGALAVVDVGKQHVQRLSCGEFNSTQPNPTLFLARRTDRARRTALGGCDAEE